MLPAVRTTPARRPRCHARPPHAITVALAGHAVEWYEFGVYGVVAAYVAASVFPADDPALSLLLTWTAYSTAFFIRPLGGIVLAHIGDRIGRRRALFTTVALMTGATFLMGLVPEYAVAGLVAPVLFVALRMLQGFAVGGEMPSATAYVVESAHPASRPRGASLLAAGTFGASLFGTLLATALAALIGADAMTSWGWRVLFLTALPLGLVALLIRRHAPESMPAPAESGAGAPLMDAWRTQRPQILRYIGVALAYNVSLSVAFGGYLNELLLGGMPPAEAVAVNATTYAALVASILRFGRLAGRLGRRVTLGIGLAGMVIATGPALALASTAALVPAMLGGALLAVPIGIYATPIYLALAEMFPPRVRVTAGAIAFNVATALASLVPATTLALHTAFAFDRGLMVWMAAAVCCAAIVLAVTRERGLVRHA